ncbi:low molecular weight phosphotyrosine protein phosphatase [Campylobacter sp. RM9756]|uniref:low molecular weight protein-tyrosine-phosphatase n=1 Tax=Campylobacter molothri TaxID=1032242 RepID=UPI001E010C07|nr:low molecular weight phosphotyrosine protein phosphatase [Campylobacter sp. RM9756]MBZ7968595.1 low molecular weight phosphotyrosine protein phosphatase [Campylobacter sp. RM9759]
MKKITFICLGNICRSPMAEFVMKDLIKKNKLEEFFFVTSAGTSGEHDGEGMHFGTKTKLESLNIKHQNFKSKKLTQKLCNESDFLITMDNSNFNNVLKKFNNVENKLLKMTDFAPNLGYNEVPDPWYSKNFDETYKIISLACENLLNFLKK